MICPIIGLLCAMASEIFDIGKETDDDDYLRGCNIYKLTMLENPRVS
jgi:hypothetical protein